MNENMNKNDTCIICYNTIDEKNLCKTNCNHIYCLNCLNTWLNRGNIDCPMCRLNIKSYKNNDIQNHIVVLNTSPENLNNIIVEESNNNNITNKRIRLIKFYFFMNIFYIGYLQYRNYTLWKECNN
jgi:uncharacterized paraquat-inducible protein A